MSEQKIFENGDVVVTDKRFIVDGRTYPVANITSVRALERTPNRIIPILLIAGGLLIVPKLKGGSLFPIGVGVLWLLHARKSYHVGVTTAAGEAQALTRRDERLVTEVVGALNRAIAMQG
ncbi:MAG TPA: DUF6232 family protein [Candidatus Kapabacteria bacterium]|nr:DUF6232 family protein [Candidatus Kapabacteria bacterium]